MITMLCAKHGQWWVKGCEACAADLDAMAAAYAEEEAEYELTEEGRAIAAAYKKRQEEAK